MFQKNNYCVIVFDVFDVDNLNFIITSFDFLTNQIKKYLHIYILPCIFYNMCSCCNSKKVLIKREDFFFFYVNQ